jgi:hypothetical protein
MRSSEGKVRDMGKGTSKGGSSGWSAIELRVTLSIQAIAASAMAFFTLRCMESWAALMELTRNVH